MQAQHELGDICLESLKAVFSQPGRTWTVPIMVVLGRSDSKPRYHEIGEKVSSFTGRDISDTMLSKRLSDLTEIGLVKRIVLAESPPQVQYELTEAGTDTFRYVVKMMKGAEDASHEGDLKTETCKDNKIS
ncbi:MAG: winged helix-turn-helix transcriptional regulator [Promethearchaeia archaeon]